MFNRVGNSVDHDHHDNSAWILVCHVVLFCFVGGCFRCVKRGVKGVLKAFCKREKVHMLAVQASRISLKSKSAKKEYFPVLIINHKATNKFTE